MTKDKNSIQQPDPDWVKAGCPNGWVKEGDPMTYDKSKSNWDYDEQDQIAFAALPKMDTEWQCYMYGSSKDKYGGMVYTPPEGQIPNWFVRWCMRVCLGCTWVKNNET